MDTFWDDNPVVDIRFVNFEILILLGSKKSPKLGLNKNLTRERLEDWVTDTEGGNMVVL